MARRKRIADPGERRRWVGPCARTQHPDSLGAASHAESEIAVAGLAVEVGEQRLGRLQCRSDGKRIADRRRWECGPGGPSGEATGIVAGTILRAGAMRLPARQADASAGASRNARRALSTFRIESEHPGISRAVKDSPIQPRATRSPCPRRSTSRAWRATMASSIAVVPPSPFTRSATLAPSRQLEIGEDRLKQTLDHCIGRQQFRAFDTLFAMDAQTELDFRRTEVEAGTADGGHRAGAQRHAHGAEIGGGGAGESGHLGEAEACSRGGTGNLVDQHRASDAAAAVTRHSAAERHIVGHHDDLDGNPLGAHQFGGKTEVQAVAGIVLDHQHRPGRTGGGADAGQPRHRRWAT